MRAWGLAAALLAVAPCAAAQTVSAAFPISVANAMRAAGYRAELQKDETGDPKILSSTGGQEFNILFDGCTKGAACQSLRFAVGVDLTEPPALEKLDAFNREFLFGKVYLDAEKDPMLEMDVITDGGGIEQSVFVKCLRAWDGVFGEFRRAMNF